ncbi:MAG TPA: type VI secretion system ATPase TssH [Acidobacteriota bacterium]|nr:type VI secretion system ATPase TssH [Acidobacteriota bacterium]
MIGVEIKSLLRCLNKSCARYLEGAAGLCVARGHYEVSVEHLLLKMAEDPNGDLQHILRHFEIEPAYFQKGVQHAVDDMRSGNPGKPVFSPLMLEWLQDGWLLASLELGLTEIRSGALLASLVDRPSRYTNSAFADLLDKISKDELRKKLLTITATSAESTPTAGTGPAERAPVAGARRADGDSALARFTLDFTGRAREGEIDPVFGRDREIRQMIDILARRRKNNPIVVGEAGVGKTAVVEGLALKIVEGDVPSVLAGVELLGLDLGLLQAGAGVKGEFENRLKSVINEVKESPKPIILFIDEAHTMIGAGGSAGGGDAANLLKPALARGELRTIAATTWSEYKKYFEKDPALARRFQLVKLDEPGEEDTILMLRGLRDKYEASHKVRILDQAVVEAVKLSSRYISGRQLPDKAVDLLDTCAARVRIGISSTPSELEDARRRIQSLGRELGALERDQAAGVAIEAARIAELRDSIAASEKQAGELEARWLQEKAAVDRVLALRTPVEARTPEQAGSKPDGMAVTPAPQGTAAAAAPAVDPEAARKELEAALKALKEVQGKSPFIHTEVDGEVIARVVSDWTGIPLGKMVRDEAQTILGFDNRLRERIKGQDHAIEALARGIRAAKAGLQNPRTPIGVFLFVGPSGVGKTETGLSLADLLFGGERFMVTINMSEFQEKHTVSRLIGSPPGYVGYGEGGVLTEAVRQRPYCVVLLDEVEKADPEVLNLFYQVFDKGMLSDGEGRVVDFKNTIILLTSNLASDTIVSMSSGPVRPEVDEIMTAIRPALSKHFKPALLARMTVVPFYPISMEAMKDIVALKLNQVGKRLMESHRMRFEYDPAAVELISQRCTEVESGARNIDHIINGTLLPMISTQILERMGTGTLTDSLRVELDPENNFSLRF